MSNSTSPVFNLPAKLRTIGFLLFRPDHQITQALQKAARGAESAADIIIAEGRFRIERFRANIADFEMDAIAFKRHHESYQTTECTNGLLATGVQAMYAMITGGGTTTANSAYSTPTYYNNSQSCIGVGTSSTAFANTQTALQGGSGVTDTANRSYAAMQASYPSIGTGGTANVLTAQSSFQNSVAVFAWNEFMLYNSPANGDGGTTVSGGSGSPVALGSNAIGLNRAVSSQGTKPNTQTWLVTYQLTLT